MQCYLLYLFEDLLRARLKTPEKEQRSCKFRATIRERQGRTDRG